MFVIFTLITIRQNRTDRKRSGIEIGGGIRKGPRVGIQTWDARSATALYFSTLPTSLSVLTFASLFWTINWMYRTKSFLNGATLVADSQGQLDRSHCLLIFSFNLDCNLHELLNWYCIIWILKVIVRANQIMWLFIYLFIYSLAYRCYIHKTQQNKN